MGISGLRDFGVQRLGDHQNDSQVGVLRYCSSLGFIRLGLSYLAVTSHLIYSVLPSIFSTGYEPGLAHSYHCVLLLSTLIIGIAFRVFDVRYRLIVFGFCYHSFVV